MKKCVDCGDDFAPTTEDQMMCEQCADWHILARAPEALRRVALGKRTHEHVATPDNVLRAIAADVVAALAA